MKGITIGKITTTLLGLLPALHNGVLAAETTHISSESHTNTATHQHVYVLGSNPSGRAAIGKALTRLGYAASGNPAGLQPRMLTMEGEDDGATNRGGLSYTEISTPRNELDGAGASYVIAGQGRNVTHELSMMAGAVEDEDPAMSWRRMIGSSGSEAELLALSFDTAEATGTQAEKWVALCDFLGMGYSTVERLNLWHFP